MAFNAQDHCLAVSRYHQFFQFCFAWFYVRKLSHVMDLKVSGVDPAVFTDSRVEPVEQVIAPKCEHRSIRRIVNPCRLHRVRLKVLQFENFDLPGFIP
jgi:hypothetical protein